MIKNLFLFSLSALLLASLMSACTQTEQLDVAIAEEAQKVPKCKPLETNDIGNELFAFTRFYTGTDVKISESILDIYEDSHGNIWFGTRYKGVARYDGRAFTYFSTEDGLAANQVNSITEDQAGNIWLSTIAGVSQYDGQSFSNYTQANGLMHNETEHIFADSKGDIWVSSKKGIDRYDGKAFTHFPLPHSKLTEASFNGSTQRVWDILEDSKSRIWLATDGHGVYLFDGKNVQQFTQADGLSSNNIISLAEDKNGHIWFGAAASAQAGGLSRFDGQKITQYTSEEKMNKNDITSIYEDKRGKLWISAKHQGVYLHTSEQAINYKEHQGFSTNHIQSMLEDKKGNFWVGFSRGLFRFSGGQFYPVSEENISGC